MAPGKQPNRISACPSGVPLTAGMSPLLTRLLAEAPDGQDRRANNRRERRPDEQEH